MIKSILNNTINDAVEKRLYIAFWPGEDHDPEIWTQSDVMADFGQSDEVISMIMSLAEGDSIQETEANLVLVRIPSYLSLEGIHDLMTQN